MDEAKVKQDGKMIWDYLVKYYSSKLTKDKVSGKLTKMMEKLAEKLGVSGYFNVLTGNLPGAKLASFTVGYLKLMWMEGYYTANPNLNPYDPITQEDEYAEYLLYSWSRGRPGYQYFDVATAWNPNYKKR